MGDSLRTLLRRISRYYRWLPVALLVSGTVLNVVTPPHVTFTPFFAAAPLTAAALLSLRGTALTGIAATMAVIALVLWRDEQEVDAEILQVITVATVSVIALGINTLVARRTSQVASARAVAEAIQRAVVPDPPPTVGPLRVAVRYQAAQLDTLIGGDLYASADSPYGVRLLIGDVRGKGLGATKDVAVTLGAFREAADCEPDLAAVARRLDAALLRETRGRSRPDDESFITALLAEVPRERPGELRVLNRGHPPPLLLAPDGSVRYLHPTEPALPLGLTSLGGDPARADTTPLPPGAMLLLYTDGVNEARNRRGEFYDPARGLSGHTFEGPEELLDHMVAQVTAHAGGYGMDDLAALAAQRPTAPLPDADAASGDPARRTARPTSPPREGHSA